MSKIIACYKLEFLKTGHFYIGSTKDYIGRKATHLYNLKKGLHKNPKIQTLYNDNPDVNNLKWSAIILADREIAYDIENQFLKEYKDNPLLLNISNDARSTISGIERTDLIKKKALLKMKKHYDNPEYISKISRSITEMWKNPIRREARKGSGNPFAKAIVIDRILFGSVKEASYALRINEKTVRSRANCLLNNNYRWYTGIDIEYDRIHNEDKFTLDFNKVNRNLLMTDKKSIFMQSRIGENNAAAKSVTINGKIYPTVKNAADNLRVSEITLKRSFL